MQLHVQYEKLKDIFRDYPYIASAYLFGSHVSGNTTPESDADIEVIIRFCDFEPTLRYIEKRPLQGRIERYARP